MHSRPANGSTPSSLTRSVSVFLFEPKANDHWDFEWVASPAIPTSHVDSANLNSQCLFTAWACSSEESTGFGSGDELKFLLIILGVINQFQTLCNRFNGSTWSRPYDFTYCQCLECRDQEPFWIRLVLWTISKSKDWTVRVILIRSVFPSAKPFFGHVLNSATNWLFRV